MLDTHAAAQRAYSQLPDFLKTAIDDEIKIALDGEIANAQKRLEERKSQIIAGVTLHLQQMLEFETQNNRLIITVKLDK